MKSGRQSEEPSRPSLVYIIYLIGRCCRVTGAPAGLVGAWSLHPAHSPRPPDQGPKPLLLSPLFPGGRVIAGEATP